MGRPASQFEGQRFGRLTVLERAPSVKSGNSYWLCECDCGRRNTVVSHSLKSGSTKSCGCLKTEIKRLCLNISNKLAWGYKTLNKGK